MRERYERADKAAGGAVRADGRWAAAPDLGAAGCPWSIRLRALLPAWLPWATRRWKLSKAVTEKLRTMSPRQIDRALHPFKHERRKRQYGRTKPGTLLKHQPP